MNGDAPPKASKVRRMKMRVSGAGGSAGKMPVSKQVGVFVLLIWFLVPVFVYALAWIFGGILARVEGWPAMVRSALLHRARTGAACPPCAAHASAGAAPRGPGRAGAVPGGLCSALRRTRRSPRSRRSHRPAACTPPLRAQWAFYYCISKLCGLTNPLVDDFPATNGVRLPWRAPARAVLTRPAPPPRRARRVARARPAAAQQLALTPP